MKIIDRDELDDAVLRSRLKAYEGTGLGPDEILGLCEMDKRSRMAKMLRWEEADAQGQLVVLPCKPGDPVYIPRKSDVIACVVQYFTIGDGAPSAFVSFECDWKCKGCPFWAPYQNYEAGDGGCEGEYGDGLIMFDDFGKTVFLNREEAEAELNGEKQDG